MQPACEATEPQTAWFPPLFWRCGVPEKKRRETKNITKLTELWNITTQKYSCRLPVTVSIHVGQTVGTFVVTEREQAHTTRQQPLKLGISPNNQLVVDYDAFNRSVAAKALYSKTLNASHTHPTAQKLYKIVIVSKWAPKISVTSSVSEHLRNMVTICPIVPELWCWTDMFLQHITA